MNSSVAERYAGTVDRRGHWTGRLTYTPGELLKPMGWKKSRMIFVGSMTDMFHDAVDEEWLLATLATAALCRRHTFLLLTKRAENMYARMTAITSRQAAADNLALAIQRLTDNYADGKAVYDTIKEYMPPGENLGWPLRNVWLGVTVEHQEAAEARIPWLLRTPAARRFVSCEPLLGAVDLRECLTDYGTCPTCDGDGGSAVYGSIPGGASDCDCDSCSRCDGSGRVSYGHLLDWVIAGAETGAGKRFMDIEWAWNLRDDCREAGVPFFFKKDSAGIRTLGGQVWDEFPTTSALPEVKP